MSAKIALPEVVTHYYLAGRQPFLSLSELEDPELDAVLAELSMLRDAGRQHRPFGPRYMQLRRLTEARLRKHFIALGGQPDRAAPHYFVLGESPWYRGLAENMAQVQLPLSALPPTQTSITYPDSFTAMGFGEQFGIGHEPRPYHARVFLVGELPDLVEQFGIPDPGWDGDYKAWATWPAEAYIEVQLWSDEPIADYLPLCARPPTGGRFAGSATAQTRARAMASAWLTARIDGGESAPRYSPSSSLASCSMQSALA